MVWGLVSRNAKELSLSQKTWESSSCLRDINVLMVKLQIFTLQLLCRALCVETQKTIIPSAWAVRVKGKVTFLYLE